VACLGVCDMSETEVDPAGTAWTPWRVVPDSGFEVADPSGSVGIVQIDHHRFVVLNAFRFADADIEEYLVRKLVDDGMGAAEAKLAVDEARTFTPREDNPTDLASIPRYMRWFENPYGKHSLAALIHDELITEEVNGGRLGSDTLSDRFFREMMKSSGVPWLKRWIMWAAVAARSRFVAGGLRTWTMVLWGALCVFGLVCGAAAFGAWLFGWSAPIDPWWLLVLATALPVVSARLWGEQWGASLVFAVAAFWIVPAAAFAGLGYLVYLALEHLASKAGYD
jgi:hypothetical protein